MVSKNISKIQGIIFETVIIRPTPYSYLEIFKSLRQAAFACSYTLSSYSYTGVLL